MPVAVFILEGHELIRRGLRAILDEAGGIDVVGESGSASGAGARIARLRPDVVVVAEELPDGSGFEFCRRISRLLPQIRVIVLAGHGSPSAPDDAPHAGAAACIPRQIHVSDLADAVRRVAAGARRPPDRAPTTGPDDLASAARDPAPGLPGPRPASSTTIPGSSALGALTPQESRVLDLIIEGMTNRQIGERLNIAEKTVKNHVTSLMGKLHVTGRTQAAAYGARLRSGR